MAAIQRKYTKRCLPRRKQKGGRKRIASRGWKDEIRHLAMPFLLYEIHNCENAIIYCKNAIKPVAISRVICYNTYILFFQVGALWL
jgi:hypothetical protein